MMEVLRTSGLREISVTFITPYENEDYSCLATDSSNYGSSFEMTATSNGDGEITFVLPAFYKKYDAELELVLTSETYGELVPYELNIVRPYIEPSEAADRLGITLEQATQYEQMARHMIDTRTEGFKKYRYLLTENGSGLDYLPIHEKLINFFSIKENGVVQDISKYSFSNDKTSIVLIDEDDRADFKPIWKTRYSSISFPENFDYEIDGEFGYSIVPRPIKEACLMLIQDISCGNNRYINKYIQEYNTDGYDIKYHDSAFSSTGNVTVDKILNAFSKNDLRARLL